MSLIENIISQSNFELVRSKIASILADEFANQLSLNQTALAEEEAKPTPDPELIALYELNIASIPTKVFEERFFRPTMPELQQETMVNVVFTNAPLDELQSVSTQIGDDRYMIEAFAAGSNTASSDADKEATLKLQRCLAIIRSIVMNPEYRYLQLDTVVGYRRMQNLQIGKPDDGSDNADAMIFGKIDLTVKIPEGVEAITGVLLEQNDTTVRLHDSDKGYVWTSGILPVDIPELTTQAGAGGIIQLSYTDEPFIAGSKIPISVIPDSGNSIDEVLVNGEVKNENPFILTMPNVDTLIEASFIAQVLTTFMKIFTAAPVYSAIREQWEWTNQEGSADNYAVNNNQTVLNLNSCKIVSPNDGGLYSENASFEGIYKFFEVRGTNYIHYRVNTGNELYFRQSNPFGATERPLQLVFYTDTQTFVHNTTFLVPIGKWVKVGYELNDTTKEVRIYYENLEDGTTAEDNESYTGTILNGNNPSVLNSGAINGTLFGNVLCSYFNINKGQRIYYATNTNSIDIYNSANNKIQDLEIFNGSVEDVFSIADDFKKLEPYQYTKGVSIYSLDTDPTNEAEYINVVFSEDGTPALSTPPTGYSLVGNFPAGSGILNGISNTVEFNNSTEQQAFADNYTFFETLIAYTYAQKRSWGTSSEVVKTEDANSVSSLEFRL